MSNVDTVTQHCHKSCQMWTKSHKLWSRNTATGHTKGPQSHAVMKHCHMSHPAHTLVTHLLHNTAIGHTYSTRSHTFVTQHSHTPHQAYTVTHAFHQIQFQQMSSHWTMLSRCYYTGFSKVDYVTLYCYSTVDDVTLYYYSTADDVTVYCYSTVDDATLLLFNSRWCHTGLL